MVSSTKSMVGTMLGASGRGGGDRVRAEHQARRLHPTINLQHRDFEAGVRPRLHPETWAREVRVKRVLSNSFASAATTGSLALGAV